MANWFVDTTLATGNNDGTTMDDAWQSIETAMEYASVATGDYIWIRRVSGFSGPSSDITLGKAGTTGAWITYLGWPRNSHAISSSDWTNGSTEVTVDDADMDREKHQGRYVTGPDGNTYLITRVVDADTIIIDREYVGSTVTNEGATIAADEDYATAQAIDDAAWTVKKTDWNADADDLPLIDFGNTNYKFAPNKNNVSIRNMEFQDGCNSTTYYAIIHGASYCMEYVGLLVKTTYNARGVFHSFGVKLKRCIVEGSGAGNTSNQGIYASGWIEDSAVYNCGSYGIFAPSSLYLRNVNIGVEQANVVQDIACTDAYISGYDVKLGGTNGYIYNANSRTPTRIPSCVIENYQKVLGAHIGVHGAATPYKTDVVAGSGDPYKRTGGADSVIQFDSTTVAYGDKGINDYEIYRCIISANTDSKSYRIYIQSYDYGSTLTADEIWLACTYVSDYDDTTEYATTMVVSDETVAMRSGADDWSQYIEVTGIQPAVASNVHLVVHFTGRSDADGVLFVDPMVVIS